MGTQISLKLSDVMYHKAKEVSKLRGYDTLQDFIREVVREKLFAEEQKSGVSTYHASEASLGRHWMVAEEQKAWEHLQKGK